MRAHRLSHNSHNLGPRRQNPLYGNNSCFTGNYGQCTLPTVPPMDWSSAAVNSNFCRLQLQYSVIYYNNDFARHFFMIVSE